MRRSILRPGFAGALLAVSAASLVAAATATAAAPRQTGNPTLQPGNEAFVGDTLSVSNGSWANDPTKFTYQWQRCAPTGDRVNCVPITGATSQSYKVQSADANHKLDAVVTASNSDGSASSDASSDVVAPAAPPTNKSRPAISGSATVGSTLTANPGTWLGATSFTYLWQQCDQNGNGCAGISGATGKTYGVRSADAGHELRLQVTAHNRFGTTRAYSNLTAVVTATPPTTTVVTTTTTVHTNRAPTIRFLSLKRVRNRVYARFYVCDDSANKLRIIERDQKARALPYRRTFSATACGTYVRQWLLLKRYRSRGRFVVTLRAEDSGGRLSKLVSRGLTFR